MNNIFVNWLLEYQSFISFSSFITLSIPLIAYQRYDKISEKIESPATIFGFFIIIYSIVFECMAQDAIKAFQNHGPIFITAVVITSIWMLIIILCPLSKYLKRVITLAIVLYLVALLFLFNKNLLCWMTIGSICFALFILFFLMLEFSDGLKKLLFRKEYKEYNLSILTSSIGIICIVILAILYVGIRDIKEITKNFKPLEELIKEFPDLYFVLSIGFIWTITSCNFKDRAAADIINKTIFRLSTIISLLFIILHQNQASDIIKFMTIPSGISLMVFEIKKYLEDKK